MNKICIFLDKDQPGYSESFIKAHIDLLNAIPINIYNYYSPGPALPADSLKLNILSIPKKFTQHYKIQKLKGILKKNKVKIALAEYGMVGAKAYKICKEMNIELVVHFHGYDAHRKDNIKNYGSAYINMFKYAKAVIAVSKFMKNKLIELGCPEEKIHLNIYGVKENFFKVIPTFSQQKTFLAVGRFTPKKAPYLTILAFHMVLAKHPDSKLIMIGTGELSEVCRKIVKSLQVEHAVEFLGAVDHGEIVKYFENCIAFIQHSISVDSGDSEGTPVAILEAGAVGIPVISTKHAGIQDVIIHGKTGFLVAESDIFSMCDYMVYVLEHPNEAKQIGMNAKLHIRENYTLEKSMNAIRQILSEV